jgi:hypothetical protein
LFVCLSSPVVLRRPADAATLLPEQVEQLPAHFD